MGNVACLVGMSPVLWACMTRTFLILMAGGQQGVIWPRVAEIALVGGLECGGFLVQVANEFLLEDFCF